MAPTKKSNLSPSGQWVWRKAPDDGGQDFGNSNVFATPTDLDTLVRETGQNSLDAAVDDEPITLRYTVTKLTKTSPEYAAFRQAMSLDDLLSHVGSAANNDTKVGRRLKDGLDRFEGSDSLLLLRIDDYGTTGLFGEEKPNEKSSPFAALMRNNLDSSKQNASAGGSFGLGKAVNWVCSSLSTVVVASSIHPDRLLPAQGSPNRFRVLGKAELTWHKGEPTDLAGPGWLAKDENASSLWLDQDDLRELQLARSNLPLGVDKSAATGTSILIVGFYDPQMPDSPDAEELADKLVHAAAKNFWPAIVQQSMRVVVEHWEDDECISSAPVDPYDFFPEFCEAYDKYFENRLSEELVEPGDVVKISVPLSVPKLKKAIGKPAETAAQAYLLVRLASSTESTSKMTFPEHIALTRGRRMVVKYWKQMGLVVGGRPFHAVLLAGTAADYAPGAELAEHFLRDAEPPAHDEWMFTSDLAANYARGSRARLTEFHKEIVNALRKTIRVKEGNEQVGPQALAKLLAIDTKQPGQGKTPKGKKAQATLKKIQAYVSNGRWQVNGVVRITDRTKRWSVFPSLSLAVEQGKPITLEWESLEVMGEGTTAPDRTLRVAAGKQELSFAGLSVAEANGVPAARSRLKIDLRVEEVDDAD